ncbi:hypothetical protein PoB_004496600 [Plakobranchus ocellatus]|uniref:Uncharacterized protein n=1 Tax=Plakobranchus ocellatus TaxID=259542 RepID=A0AAV4B517_9GAST|nr:hypothetical protein PoB_004496600 [Plakobranchus ocellatus]
MIKRGVGIFSNRIASDDVINTSVYDRIFNATCKAFTSQLSSVAVTTETLVMPSPPAATAQILVSSQSQRPISVVATTTETPEVSGHQWF